MVYGFTPREDSRGPAGIFYIPTVFLSFSPARPLRPAPHEPRHGGSPCAQNLNPLVIKSGLYATSGTPCARAARAFTYEKVKCIQVGSAYMACVADQV